MNDREPVYYKVGRRYKKIPGEWYHGKPSAGLWMVTETNGGSRCMRLISGELPISAVRLELEQYRNEMLEALQDMPSPISHDDIVTRIIGAVEKAEKERNAKAQMIAAWGEDTILESIKGSILARLDNEEDNARDRSEDPERQCLEYPEAYWEGKASGYMDSCSVVRKEFDKLEGGSS